MCYFIEYLWKEGLFGCLKLQLGSKTSFYRAKNEKDTCRTVKTPRKRTNWYILRAQNLFLFATVRKIYPNKGQCSLKCLLKCLLARNVSKNTEKTTKKLTYQLTHVNSSLLFFCCKIQINGKPALEYFLTREKSHG